ncbi:NAD-glutamate dehydrogenase domain-containing protein [Pseudodesulfovibrio sp.]|uniref:NAD-glutamate dehydrogenase domain-containing protein n=1 Tax=unclassified Pseudodesulfovibrio TaxID=2661612 RepID=UPI003AFF9731
MVEFLPERTGIVEEVKRRLGDSVESLVVWFHEQMPEYYFRTHGVEERIRHLMALASGMVREERQSVVLHSPCNAMVTHITPGGNMRVLANVLSGYLDREIQMARIYSSRDDTIRLDTFLFGPQPRCSRQEGALRVHRGEAELAENEMAQFEAFLASASEDYVEKFEPDRAVRHFHTCGCLKGRERVEVLLEKDVHPGFDRIVVAMEKPPTKGLLFRVVNILARESVPVDRAYADRFEPEGGEALAIMSFYVDRSRLDIDPQSERWDRLRRQLELSKWFALHGLETLADENGWELGKVMLFQAACEFAHQFLVSRNIHAYTSARILAAVLHHRELAETLFGYFEARFDPALGEDRKRMMAARREVVRNGLADVDNEVHRNILTYIYRFFRYTLRTNYYLEHKLGLAFRLDPLILAPLPRKERPFGLYCFHGPYCFAFHVRYRDMARGGVRLVPTRSQEQFEMESNRLLDEVTKLARAQQFKNKDIPEGGSKAVILLGPEAETDLAVRSVVDAFLDLLVVPDESKNSAGPEAVDYLGRDEVIFLGPDENITSAHIEWMVERAARRGYRWPATFMSSKPGAGIAHKEYGVTSEGVVVFAEALLRTLGIDPKSQTFSVKLTGGPAGDVASNVIKILIREYGKNVRIIAMSDGHGAAYDPDGMNHDELLRLVGSGLRASDFAPLLLTGKGAFVVSASDPGGVRLRNSLHNTAQADLFIPAGGRPETINRNNWKHFLASDGTPSARGIVEGANIFISVDARAELERSGVLVVPGPSANKTGVICSSYEILAGLVLSEAEFLAIKAQYVEELLDILRIRAASEANLLMREYRLAGGGRSLTELSFAVSEAINGLADAIAGMLQSDARNPADDPVLRDVVLAYCPAVLTERYPDRVLSGLPGPHQLALVSAFIAARIIYREGLGWAEGLLAVRNAKEVVFDYLAQERRVDGLLAEVRAAGLPDGEAIADILEREGRKRLTLDRLGLG